MGQSPVGNQSFGSQVFGPASISIENARFMSRVYGWMTAGLCLTGVVAWNVSGNPRLVQTIFGNPALFVGFDHRPTWDGPRPFVAHQPDQRHGCDSDLFSVRRIDRTHAVQYLSGLHGLQHRGSFRCHGFRFAGLSGFGFVTKRDLGPVGSFCMMGLFGLVGFGLLSMIFPRLMGEGASFVFSIVGIIVFAGLTAYDTQKIKRMNTGGNEGTDAGRKQRSSAP